MIRATGQLSSLAIAIVLCTAPAAAQAPPGGLDQKAAPSQAPDAKGPAGPQHKDEGSAKGAEKAEPKANAGPPPGKDAGKGAAQVEPKEKAGKAAPQKSAEPKDKGAPQKAAGPKEKATKGTPEKAAEAKDKATNGAPERTAEPKGKAAPAQRVQLSEQERSNVGKTILKDGRVNRVAKPAAPYKVGARVPRSVRLAVLPAAVIAIVPGYRSYRYFVVEDEIYIVDERTYDVVDVITEEGRPITTAERAPAAPAARGPLALTKEEQGIILGGVDLSVSRTLGLGAMTEGAEVPRDVQARDFPEAIVRQVPKVGGYRYVTAENRLAIVDPHTSKVVFVIEGGR